MQSPAAAITIRAIEPADAEAVSLLTAQLGYQRTPAEVREWIETVSSAPGEQTAFVAVVDDDAAGQNVLAGNVVAGWVEVSVKRSLQSPPFALIGGLVVKDGQRSRGIGHQLCARAEAWAWEHGVETVRVTSRSTRHDAHRFYLRDGYREVKTSLVFEKSRPR